MELPISIMTLHMNIDHPYRDHKSIIMVLVEVFSLLFFEYNLRIILHPLAFLRSSPSKGLIV